MVYGVRRAAGKSEPSPCHNYYVVKQQTPKPEAQFPEAVPPWSVHSSAVIHSPLIVGSMTVVHSSFGNVTTENKEKASVSKKKSLLGLFWKEQSLVLVWFFFAFLKTITTTGSSANQMDRAMMTFLPLLPTLDPQKMHVKIFKSCETVHVQLSFDSYCTYLTKNNIHKEKKCVLFSRAT